MISHGDSDLHFPDGSLLSSSSCASRPSAFPLWKKRLFSSSAHFFNWAVWDLFLMLNCMSYLYILYILYIYKIY